MKQQKRSPFFIGWFIVILVVALFLAADWLGEQNADELSYSEVVSLFQQERVISFTAQDDEICLLVQLDTDDTDASYAYLTSHISVQALRDDLGDLLLQQLADGTLESYSFLPDSEPSVLVKAIPYFLAGAFLLMIWAVITARANSNTNGLMAGFGQAKTTLSSSTTTFDDVAGAVEEKQELKEIVEFLQNPEKFHTMGAKVPKGVLLVGPPGTGKTLLARAVAGEADAAFLSISGSEFMEMFVGVGASRVRDLFAQARKVAPSIIFIDEIDAVGRRRGAGMGGSHDEREQTLNQILVEMDGFQKDENVIVLAATNREDILDPALLRPGRFDRQVYVGAPDARGREEILRLHTKNKRLDSQVDLRRVALHTAGFTGADLQNLMNEAAIHAVRSDHPVITGGDIQEAMMKVLIGPEKRSRVQLQKDLRDTAIHEAGHAVAMYLLPTCDPVHQITIIPRGRTLGVTISLPDSERSTRTRNQMYEEIVSLLGGRVAEALFCDDISTGASNDIQRATKEARNMVARFGMSDTVGTVSYDDGDEIFVGLNYERTRPYSEQTAGTLDTEVRELVKRAYDHCRKLLTESSDKLMKVADFLVANETMSGAQFRACMEGKPIPKGQDQDLFAAKGQ